MNHPDPSPRPVLLDDARIFELLRTSRRIAVVGASSNPTRPSNGVFRTLLEAGYLCVPVNPNETEIEGIAAVATLAEAQAALGGRIDIVDVFRRPELTEQTARESVAVGARALWLQLGVSTGRRRGSPPKAAWRSSWTAARQSSSADSRLADRIRATPSRRTASRVLPGSVLVRMSPLSRRRTREAPDLAAGPLRSGERRHCVIAARICR
jgi:uncharacterized protein